MRIVIAGPFDVKGRYKGGIHAIVNAIITRKKGLPIPIVPFDTCRVARKKESVGKISIDNLRNSLYLFRDLPVAVKKSDADILYYHSSQGIPLFKDLLVLHRTKKKTNIKIIIHIHYADYENIITHHGLLDKIIMKILKNDVDRIVFLSRETAKCFVEEGISESKMSVIYNFSTIEYTECEIQKKLEHNIDVPQLLFVGSIDRRKGVFELLECLSKSDTKFVLHICGICPDSQTQAELDNYRKLFDEKLVYHGYVDGEAKRSIYLSADILVLPSYCEGLPMVIMEAYHAGCAVIATRVGAIPEVVSENNGILIDAGNRQELITALEDLLQNPQKIKQMKQNNIMESANYTLDSFVTKMKEVCESVL